MDIKEYRNKIYERNPKLYITQAMAKEVQKMRVGAGFSQEKLAQKLKTTQSSIARTEAAVHELSLSNLWLIAQATGYKMELPVFTPLKDNR